MSRQPARKLAPASTVVTLSMSRREPHGFRLIQTLLCRNDPKSKRLGVSLSQWSTPDEFREKGPAGPTTSNTRYTVSLRQTRKNRQSALHRRDGSCRRNLSAGRRRCPIHHFQLGE